MPRFNEDGADIVIMGHKTTEVKEALEELLLEVPEVVEMGRLASLAPRHVASKPDARRDLAEDKMFRRKWFGRQRGRVRGTFRAIGTFLADGSKALRVVIGGSHCVGGAWAYTPDDQDLGGQPAIHLCPLFFKATAAKQLATVVHELTHLVKNTADVTREPDLEDVFAIEPLSAQQEQAKFTAYLQQNLNDDRPHIAPKAATRSAYNYENFVLDLIDAQYDEGALPPAVRTG